MKIPSLIAAQRYVGMNIPTGAIGVWGALRVNGWGGNAFQITRASDSTTLDIPFLSSGAADWALADRFGSGTTYKITKLYDQSGNGYDLTTTSQAPRQYTNTVNGIRSITFGSGSVNQDLKNTSLPITDHKSMTGCFLGTQTMGQFTSPIYEVGNPTTRHWLGSLSAVGAADQASLGMMFPTVPAVVIRAGHGASNRTVTINDLNGTSNAGGTPVAATGVTIGNANGNVNTGRIELLCLALYDSILSTAQKTQFSDSAYGASLIQQSNLGDVCTFVGDSITMGTPNTGGAANYMACHAPIIISQLGRPLVFYNIGISNQAASTCAGQTTFPALTYRAGKFNVAVIWYGTNDLGANASAATTYTNLQTIATNYKNAGYNKIIMGTIMPRNTAFTNGQTHVNFETARLALNTSIRNGVGVDFDVLADVGGDAIMGNDANVNSATYFQDALHPTAAGNQIIYPYFLTALLSVL